ncbi:uncharacterized protein BT62DRAFT_906237 [Guyanagaster necrorhizus]|uniref:Uncharacterized protein n=1 Tax=Guyanagaster necrorhizus TaxID=856835 RepID=A0A9P7VLV1_9AGAR|nr:uncharacterized protein BT62DRAFT_906237 [Guyanagaster necrorhizus MCA 3950]KAG7442289.1 hypothetical protein BT62DRAFT_906237 [Guyanagaster necrorhizus MCA 3950]
MANPRWPSLYDPSLEFFEIPNHNAEQPGAVYLYHYSQIFTFTLYWTLCFYSPFFIACAGIAFLNVLFPPRRSVNNALKKRNEQRSRITLAVIVLLVFLGISVLSVVCGATVVSLVLMGLFRSGGFSFSTWVPFCGAGILVLVSLLNSWPSVIHII